MDTQLHRDCAIDATAKEQPEPFCECTGPCDMPPMVKGWPRDSGPKMLHTTDAEIAAIANSITPENVGAVLSPSPATDGTGRTDAPFPDWREGCFVARSGDGKWSVFTPDKLHWLGGNSWHKQHIEFDREGGNYTGIFPTMHDAIKALRDALEPGETVLRTVLTGHALAAELAAAREKGKA